VGRLKRGDEAPAALQALTEGHTPQLSASCAVSCSNALRADAKRRLAARRARSCPAHTIPAGVPPDHLIPAMTQLTLPRLVRRAQKCVSSRAAERRVTFRDAPLSGELFGFRAGAGQFVRCDG